jgi:hypothetical protein
MVTQKKKVSVFLTMAFLGLFLTAIGSNWYHYMYSKNYQYQTEAQCNPENEKCFYRDCENEPDSCPPNNLSYYKIWEMSAADFPQCSDNSCERECSSNKIACEPTLCDESVGDVCQGAFSTP